MRFSCIFKPSLLLPSKVLRKVDQIPLRSSAQDERIAMESEGCGFLSGTPKGDGFHMPGEWCAHSGCFLLWPRRRDTWRSGALPGQRNFAEVARTLSNFEKVTVAVNPEHYSSAKDLLLSSESESESHSIRVVEMEADDAWIRDSGPTFVVDTKGGEEVRAVHWDFNAWGGLYSNFASDKLVGGLIAQLEKTALYKAPFILEGGSIHTDGQGTLLTTEECLLSPTRNPHLSKSEIENLLLQYTGTEKVIWLKRGLYADETLGHVDNLCCFVKPGEVVLAWTDDEEDPQYEISRECLQILKTENLVVHKLLIPENTLYLSEEEATTLEKYQGSEERKGGRRLAASYVNFYLPNNGVVVPQFNDPNDEKALEKLREIFPERKVVGLQTREILLGGGNIHCITQQRPAPPKASAKEKEKERKGKEGNPLL